MFIAVILSMKGDPLMKILIAEDDSTSRSIHKNMLENFGNRVSTAENGLEAWELFQTDVFPLVITDWMMPEMNGLDFCRKIRKSGTSCVSYIIMVTDKNRRADILAGLKAGADDYIMKPYDPD